MVRSHSLNYPSSTEHCEKANIKEELECSKCYPCMSSRMSSEGEDSSKSEEGGKAGAGAGAEGKDDADKDGGNGWGQRRTLCLLSAVTLHRAKRPCIVPDFDRTVSSSLFSLLLTPVPHRSTAQVMMTSAQQSVLKSVSDKPRKCIFCRYAQDEILQYVQLSADEDYCIPSTVKCYSERYVRCQLSFEDPQVDKLFRETNDVMFELYDYLTLKLEAMFHGKSHLFPQLFTKEWENYYSSLCPENDLKERRRNNMDIAEFEEDQFQVKSDDRLNNKKDKKFESEEKRNRKRIQRVDKNEKSKKMKCN
ncbi:unnamed protein product [Thelazia callipaeda]|uniref:Uncharacterized protein n=1 Tax=Thelazia callipaeda TaxID=103827 RepID=A0A0N5D0M8_THECL|nr:unnamed protein product [Thelazia callipaeda]